VIRAFRLDRQGLKPVYEYLDECRRLGTMPRMVLLDAYVPGRPGGTGRTTDWTLAAEYNSGGGCPQLVLAGGLTPDNIAEAIQAVRPAAVDTASGVERAPGKKDSRLMAAFVRAAREAFGRVGDQA
jgi:phosphoribosylanthranilate isomerase